MRKFLDDYFNSLSTRQNVRVTSMLEEAKLAKDDLPRIVDRLAGVKTVPLFITTEQPYQLIRQQGFFSNLRDAHARIQEIYDVENMASLLLDSHREVLSGEVSRLESELNSMEALANNYAFLLSDNGAYDFAYLETFTDTLGREEDLTTVPDRSALSFGPDAAVSVNTTEGTIGLPQELTASHALRTSIVGGNVAAWLRNTTVAHITQSGTLGWRTTLNAPSPITSGVSNANNRLGAQVVLEFRLDAPAPCSEIRITPFADSSQEVAQVILFGSDDPASAQNVLNAHVVLDRPYTLHFPMRAVKKFHIILNQPAYRRVTTTRTVEDDYRRAYEALRARLSEIAETNNVGRTATYNRLLTTFNATHRRPTPLVEPIAPVSVPQKSHREQANSLLQWRRQRAGTLVQHAQQIIVAAQPDPLELDNLFVKTLHEHKDLYHLLSRREVENFENWIQRKSLSDFDQGFLTLPVPVADNGFGYEYSFGLRSVTIGIESMGYKGFWVSKAFPADGDFGEVRLKVDEENYRSPDSSLHDTLLTSTEYSVSNRSAPVEEDDWIAILPVGQKVIESERLYPNEQGDAYFRFGADGTAAIEIFRNGVRFELDTSADLLYDENRQGIVGVRLPARKYTTEDILTARYFPVRDYTTINFESEGFAEAPLVSTYGEDGAGERFEATVGRNQVSLDHIPYVDENAVIRSTYNMTTGLVPYQPIVVRLADGTLAVNLTNYKGNTQASLPSEGYYYLHSGNTLLFNRPIDRPFRVYYQYLQNNVRVRVVCRCNTRDFVSPKVKSYHIKAKTRRPQREKLL